MNPMRGREAASNVSSLGTAALSSNSEIYLPFFLLISNESWISSCKSKGLERVKCPSDMTFWFRKQKLEKLEKEEKAAESDVSEA